MIEYLVNRSVRGEPVRRAYFDVSYCLLKELLKLPEDTEIVLVTSPGEAAVRQIFRVYVDHPDFAEVDLASGCIPMRVDPMYKTENVEIDNMIIRRVMFQEW